MGEEKDQNWQTGLDIPSVEYGMFGSQRYAPLERRALEVQWRRQVIHDSFVLGITGPFLTFWSNFVCRTVHYVSLDYGTRVPVGKCEEWLCLACD